MEVASKKKTYINAAIGIALLLIIWHLPPFGPVTTYGMQLIAILISCVWLWSTVGMVWPSALGIIAMMLSEHGGLAVAQSAFSNSNVIFLLFAFPVFGVISESDLFKVLSMRIITSKAVGGKPYLFAFILFAISAVFSSFANGMIMLLILWSVIKSCAESVGVDKNDQFCKAMIVGTTYASLMGYVCIPFCGFGVILCGLFTSYTGITVPPVQYMVCMFAATFTGLLLLMAAMKFVFRVDTSAFKNLDTTKLRENKESVTLNKDQKFLGIVLILFILTLCMPSFLPASLPITAVLKSMDIAGISLLFFVILSVIRNGENKAYLDMMSAGKHISWDMIYLFACAIQLSSSIAGADTGVGTLMGMAVNSLLGGLSSYLFVVAFAVLCLLLTNVANNWVVLMIMISTLALYAQTATINAPVAFMMIAFCGNIGLFLPSASLYGAMLHSSDWLTSGEVYKYAGTCIVATIISVLVYSALGLAIF